MTVYTIVKSVLRRKADTALEVLLAVLFLAAMTYGGWNIAAYAQEPDEETKKRALMLGYTLNGDSMVRDPSRGSIDVRDLLELTKPHITTLPPKAENGPLPAPKPR